MGPICLCKKITRQDSAQGLGEAKLVFLDYLGDEDWTLLNHISITGHSFPSALSDTDSFYCYRAVKPARQQLQRWVRPKRKLRSETSNT